MLVLHVSPQGKDRYQLIWQDLLGEQQGSNIGFDNNKRVLSNDIDFSLFKRTTDHKFYL